MEGCEKDAGERRPAAHAALRAHAGEGGSLACGVVAVEQSWEAAWRDGAELVVTGASRHACNVALSGRLSGRGADLPCTYHPAAEATYLWIGARSCGFGPGGLVLDRDCLPKELARADRLVLRMACGRGVSFSVGAGCDAVEMRVGADAARFSASLRMRPPVRAGALATQKAARRAEGAIRRQGSADSPFHPAFRPVSGADARIRAALVGRGSELCDRLLRGPSDGEGAPRALQALLGLGPGSTPSGDDFAVGALAAFLAVSGKPGAGCPQAVSAALQGACGKTTFASRPYLLAASRGRFSNDVVFGVSALLTGEGRGEGGACSSIARLLSHGATSGTDLLAGAAAMLRAFGEAEAAPKR